MADQRIFFEQGSPFTGDSGERGTSTEGVASVKPVNDGERAEKTTFNRPTENLRLRTEVLRTAGEDAKYLLDSDIKWIITAGNADGLSPGPLAMPGISAWDPVGGTFTTSAAIVVQPINTPDSDKQETKTYSFTDGLSQTASIAFTPLSDSNPPVSGVVQKRAYNGANLIRIKWVEVEPAALSSAVVPNYCDVAITGDPEHILTITIRNDDTTQMANVKTALETLETAAGQLGSIGLGFVITGTVATSLLYDPIPDKDYRMTGTFEREVHYIPSATFVNFFAIPNSLSDGDTLSVHFLNLFTEDNSAAQPTGRRESVPSNNTPSFPATTTVASSQLFITSTATDVYKIPLSIPLCKRIGDDLYWMDGTVVLGTQSSFPVYFGENGRTSERFDDLLASDATVTGDWLFEGGLSAGTLRDDGSTGHHILFSDSVTAGVVSDDIRPVYNEYTVGHTVTGDVQNTYSRLAIGASVTGNVNGIYNELVVADTITLNSIGLHTVVTCTGDPGDVLLGGLTTVTVSDTGGGEVIDEIYAQSHVTTFTGEIANAKATDVGGLKATLELQGGDLTRARGCYVLVPSTSGVSATVGYVTGYDVLLEPPSTLTIASTMTGINADVHAYNAAVSTLKGLDIDVNNTAAVSSAIYGTRVAVDCDAASGVLYGSYLDVDCSATSTSITGQRINVDASAAVGTSLVGQQIALTPTVAATVGLMLAGISTTTTANSVASSVYGIRNVLNSVADTAATAIGIYNYLKVDAQHSTAAYANKSELEIEGTSSLSSGQLYTHQGVVTVQGSTTETQITDAGGMHLQVNLGGGAISSNADGLFIDVPSTAGTAATVSVLSGLRLAMTQPSTVTATEAYGAFVLFNNTNGPTGDGNAAGLYVSTVAAPRGVDIQVDDATYGQYLATTNTATSLMIDTADATIPLRVGAGGSTAYSRIDRSLVVGMGGTPPTDKVALNIAGAFQTDVTTLATSSLSGTDTIDAENKSVIYVTGTDAPGSFQDIATLSNGVTGQWLIIINDTDSGGPDSVDLTFVETGNIKIAGATSTIISTGEAIQFVYANAKWWEVYRGA